MDNFLGRRAEILRIAAEKAFQTRLKPSGFWVHNDLRDNVYLALHGMAFLFEQGAADYSATAEFQLCEQVLLRTLALQDIDSRSETYGHFPLGLADVPADSTPNKLPVELMGSLLIFFAQKYPEALSTELKLALDIAFQHIYHSKFYRNPVRDFGHHEAKYTASKLLLGYIYQDQAIFEQGRVDLLATLGYLRENGFREYGALPWFWHWVQAYTCAWEVIDDVEIRSKLSEMLELLWKERSLFYLQGSWSGPHSRVLEHDVPEDLNGLHDYIQFGDFQCPNQLPRLEGAGLFTYRVSAEIRQLTLNNEKPQELFKKINLTDLSLHTYLYKTNSYAVGGMWERREEYLNEQHRWDITLSSRSGGNQAFFFLPGEGWSDNDARHEGGQSEVIYHKNAVLSLYSPLAEAKNQRLIGILPSGQWIFEEKSGYGQVDNVFIRFHLENSFIFTESETKGYYLQSQGNIQIAAMEVMALKEALAFGISDLTTWAAAARLKKPSYNKAESGESQLAWETLMGDKLLLGLESAGKLSERTINGASIDFTPYQI